ncbi:L-lactate dehydrogenase (cytochrome) [Microdochium nivale]|nr:L-lactate dehydrogenase (cytochrome) [Microdochium nivale]
MPGGDNDTTSKPRALIRTEDIIQHNTSADLWMVIDGVVYDLTDFAPVHPGGPAVLGRHAGRDGTAAYLEVHPPSLIKASLPEASVVGTLDESSVTETWSRESSWSPSPPQPSQASTSTSAGNMSTSSMPPPPGRTPALLETLISTHDFATAASASFSPKAWAFASSAATDCLTHGRNTSAYSAITLRPRVLRDVRASRMDLSTTMLGRRISSPVFCAPTSMGRMFHPQGEREIGRACRALGIPQCVSTSCSFPFAEVMGAHEEEGAKQGDEGQDVARGKRLQPSPPVFFQLYMDKDRSKSEKLLRDVVAQGARGIFLTVDAPVIGKREADERIQADEIISTPMTGAGAPKTDNKGGGVGRLIGGFIDAGMTWDAVPWIRSVVGAEIPIAIKGVQTAADAVRAMEAGANAVYLSNHGGRSLDTSPATILVLLELQRCCPQVFDAMEVYVDGGVKRGTDIFKALCLGARAVGIGRGFLYGLNYGQEGIEKYIGILNDELQTTMQMCGITSLDQCHPGLLNTGAVDHLIPQGEEHPYAKWRPKPRL